MRILILDDDEVRHGSFRRLYLADGETVVSVSRYSDFVTELSTSEWDLIHLDHDLGDKVTGDTYVDGWGKTVPYDGCHAVARICELKQPPPLVVVHSINTYCSPNMVKDLKKMGIEAVWEPFGEMSL